MMRKKPMLYSADQIRAWDVDEQCRDTEGREYWQPARPEGRSSFIARFVLAWKVFTGECDALYWKDRS